MCHYDRILNTFQPQPLITIGLSHDGLNTEIEANAASAASKHLVATLSANRY